MARYRVGLETRDRILAAVRALLGDVGFDGTTLKAITQQAGVGAGSFYNQFETKDEAVLEVIRDAIGAVDPDPSGLGNETVTNLIDAFVRFITGDPPLARIYVNISVSRGLTDPVIGDRVIRHHAARVGRFEAALARALPDRSVADRHRDAETMVATLTGFAVRALVDETFDFADHARHLGEVFALAAGATTEVIS